MRFFVPIYMIIFLVLLNLLTGADVCFATDNKFELSQKEWEQMHKSDYIEDFKEFERDNDNGLSWVPQFDGFLAILKPLSYILLGIIIVLVIIFIICNTKMLQRFKKQNKNIEFLIENIDEQLHDVNLDELLLYALKNLNFNLAIRIRYLMIIKKISELNLIRWTKDKTNGQYLLEMRSHASYQKFKEITLLFEKVWYGDLHLQESEYHRYSTYFEHYLILISNRA